MSDSLVEMLHYLDLEEFGSRSEYLFDGVREPLDFVGNVLFFDSVGFLQANVDSLFCRVS